MLQGLLDSDGGPVAQAERTCRIQYTTGPDRLRDDVTFLVRSLGRSRVPRMRRRTRARSAPRPTGRATATTRTSWTSDCRRDGAVPAGAQAGLYDATGGGRPLRFIDSIEPAGIEETVCIQVAAADSLYVTDDFLVTHNTLNDAFIILDEAQNTTAEQMKMFLTRLGFGSKIVVTGDVTQVDLPGGARSGLRVVPRRSSTTSTTSTSRS